MRPIHPPTRCAHIPQKGHAKFLLSRDAPVLPGRHSVTEVAISAGRVLVGRRQAKPKRYAGESAMPCRLSAFSIFAFLLWSVVGAAADTGSAGISNIFAPESTPAKSIFDLSIFVLAITGIIFAVVFILLVYSVVKFRATAANDDREPAQVYGSTQIELAWTIIPILIVVVLFLATARVIHAIQDAPKPPALSRSPLLGTSSGGSFDILGSESLRPTNCTFR